MKYFASLVAFLLPSVAAAQSLPPIDPILLNTAAVTCIKIADSGAVSDAFIVTSAGSPERDRAVIEWVKQLRWGAAKPGDGSRNQWMPIPVAFGNVPAHPMPSHCEPSAAGLQTTQSPNL